MENQIENQIKFVNPYIAMMREDYSGWALELDQARLYRGSWRTEAFQEHSIPNRPLDLEIGTGNGFFFGHRALQYPERLLVGMEVKFKPLVQSIRRVRRAGGTNARIIHSDANEISNIFAAAEINDTFIHFPDPWERRRQQKNRLIQPEFLHKLSNCQQSGARLEFKTDSAAYFAWAIACLKEFASVYNIEVVEEDLHASHRDIDNFITRFERLWMEKGLKIHYMNARRI